MIAFARLTTYNKIMPPKNYQLIDHTADLGINVKGKDQAELFANTATALFDIMTNIKDVAPISSKEISLTADSSEDLMNFWLSALLQEFTLNNRLLSQFKINRINEKTLTASVHGEPFNPDKHEIYTEIKAVTFHELRISKDETGWQAQVIFDV